MIDDFEAFYQEDSFVFSDQVQTLLLHLIQDSYQTADNHLLEIKFIELADWEEFETQVFIPQPTIVCQRFYTFNRLVDKEEFLEAYHFGEEGRNFDINS